jgi:hypothetical protein
MYVFMLKKYTYLLVSLFVVCCTISCHNDVGDINPESEQTNQITKPLEFGEIEGTLIGYIFDNTNNPISGANVSIYSGETTTNEFGMFNFVNAKLDPQGTFIKVEKEGYLVGSDLVYPSSNGKGTSRIMMLKVLNVPSFQASEGGVVEIVGGGTIAFPPSSLIRSNGSIYDGEVRSTAYRLSPSDYEFGSKMCGGLLGIDKEGRHRVLSTFGIIGAELRGFDNQILKMKSDKVAELTVPIEENLQSLVADNITAWNFDFQDGLWNEKIIATNNNQEFITTIDALGFWNMAIPSAISQVCGRLIYTNELSAKNYVIHITNNGLSSRIGITDQGGYFCGKLPKGENLVLQVVHPVCGDVLMELSIGPFDDVGTIGDVVLEIEEKYISGIVECGGEGINDATIIATNIGQTNFFKPKANGSFSINLEELTCGSSSEFTLFAYDNSTGMASQVMNLDSDISESIKLEVCQEECLADGAFMYEKEDYCQNGPFSSMSVEVSHGSGEYTYEWPDGSTEIFYSDPTPEGEICVNVKDVVTGCEYQFCDLVNLYKKISIVSIYSSNTECLVNSGFINLEVEGGRGALEYEWSGPDGYFSDDSNIKDLSPGVYSLLIRDDADCEASESNEVYNVTTPIELSKEDQCSVSIITIEENDGYKPYTYNWSGGNASGNQLFVYFPGVYNLTMTDVNLCTRSTQLTINKVGLLPEIDPNFDCEAGVVTFSNIQPGFDYFYQAFGSSEKIPIEVVSGKLEVLILEAGYRFEIGSEIPEVGDCSKSEEIELPKFDGLEIGAIINPTCETCADGSIEYEVVLGAECQDCIPGEVIVINAENGSDVTDLNDQKELEIGEYYVIVLDDSNECYIAHSLVILE